MVQMNNEPSRVMVDKALGLIGLAPKGCNNLGQISP